MKRLIIAVVIGIFLSSIPVWSAMYRYKDAGGVVRFTDNLADVPEKQRKGSVYENAPSPAAPSGPEELSGRIDTSGHNQMLPEKSQRVDSDASSSQSEEISSDPSRIDQFLKIKTALDEENSRLIKESLALSEEKKTISGNDAVKAFNEKVSALNARVDDYEKRRAAFQKEANAFNVSLKKRLAQPSQSPPAPSP